MGKVISKSPKPGFFAEGGKGHMFGRGTTTPAVAGQTGRDSNSAADPKFASGGSGHMFGQGHANPMVPGQSAKSSQ